MNLKNYTSSIHPDVTIGRIERLLVDAGATGIMKEYRAGRVVGLFFQIVPAPNAAPLTIKLAANVDACIDSFWKDYCAGRTSHSRKTRNDFIDQGIRTAWKIQQDWVEVQVSLIRLRQQEITQAFLPYVWDGTRTFYERLRNSHFRGLLTAPAEEETNNNTKHIAA